MDLKVQRAQTERVLASGCLWREVACADLLALLDVAEAAQELGQWIRVSRPSGYARLAVTGPVVDRLQEALAATGPAHEEVQG